MTQNATLALVGAVGGAGTTRTAVECGAVLARAGRNVTILDAAFATQGLADYVEGRIDADLTAVLADDVDLEAATYAITTETPGRLRAIPAHGPFDRLARAKTAGAAERFERQIAAAGLSADVVIVDTPPIAANQAVAAVNACNRIALVAPDTVRGADGVARLRGRLQDLDVSLDAVLAACVGEDDGEVLQEATGAIPESDVTSAGRCPAAATGDDRFAQGVVDAVESILGLDLGIEFADPGRFERLLPGDP